MFEKIEQYYESGAKIEKFGLVGNVQNDNWVMNEGE